MKKNDVFQKASKLIQEHSRSHSRMRRLYFLRSWAQKMVQIEKFKNPQKSAPKRRKMRKMRCWKPNFLSQRWKTIKGPPGASLRALVFPALAIRRRYLQHGFVRHSRVNISCTIQSLHRSYHRFCMISYYVVLY